MGLYHSDHRALQERFDTVRLADRLEKVKVLDHIADDDRAFIEARDMFFIATTDTSGRPSCSYKGGDPGFVRVLDAHTLVFPNYDGNGMYRPTGRATHCRRTIRPARPEPFRPPPQAAARA